MSDFPQNFRLHRNQEDSYLSDDIMEVGKVGYIGNVPRSTTDTVGAVTGTNWDPAMDQATVTTTLSLDVGTTVDPDSSLTTGTIVFTGADVTSSSFRADVDATERWRFQPLGVIAADLIYAHGTTTVNVLDITGAGAAGRLCYTNYPYVDGTKMFADTSAIFILGCCLGLEADTRTLANFNARRSTQNIPRGEVDVTSFQTRTGVLDAKAHVVYQPVNRRSFIQSIWGDLGASTAETWAIFAEDSAGNTRTLWTGPGYSTTATTVTFDPVLVAEPGERIIGQIIDTAAMTTPQLRILGGYGV